MNGDEPMGGMTMARDHVEPRLVASDQWSGMPARKVLCPICRDDYQHHGDVAVFSRVGGEDAPIVVSGTAHPGSPALTGGNPSARRDGIRVQFVGECGHEWFLEIVQHKGQTFVAAVTA